MRTATLLGLMVFATPALAWEAMPVADLAGLTVRFADAVQSLAADGRTVYTGNEPSHGRWRDQGGLYCSVWPPGDSWNCYSLERDGNTVRFIADDGTVTEGVIE